MFAFLCASPWAHCVRVGIGARPRRLHQVPYETLQKLGKIQGEIAAHRLPHEDLEWLAKGAASGENGIFFINPLLYAADSGFISYDRVLRLGETASRKSMASRGGILATFYWRALCGKAHYTGGPMDKTAMRAAETLERQVIHPSRLRQADRDWLTSLPTTKAQFTRVYGWGLAVCFENLPSADKHWLLRQAALSERKAKGVEKSYMQYILRSIRFRNPGK